MWHHFVCIFKINLKSWIKNELSPIVNKVTISKRLTDSPAIVVG